MASRHSIQMNFDSAKRKADELDGIADSLTNLANNNMDASMNNLNAAWTGDSATNFVRKGFTLIDQMKRTAQDLRNTASGIRTIAKNIYDAEMEALRIAEEREAAERAARERANSVV